MPKGKRKDGQGKKFKGRTSQPPSDDEVDTADNMSTVSGHSEEHGSIPEEEGDDTDESSSQENLEDKLKECMEGLQQKSAQGRKNCMENLVKALGKKCLFDFLIDRKLTITDSLVRCLKKGKGEEQALAAKCLSLVCVQLGLECEDMMTDIQPVFTVVLTDTTASLKARAECATSLAVANFLACSDIDTVMKAMETLVSVFMSSYRKGDKSIPNISPDVCRLHAAALAAWSLLLSIAPVFLVNKMIASHLSRLPDLLHSQDVELRIVAGETIALMYELAREEDEEYEGPEIYDLCEMLKKLATDSQKFRAKKDRKQQRSSFRDILRTVEEGESPEICVKFGRETFNIDSWVKQKQYDVLCHAIESGIYQHLQDNGIIREVFDLGSPLLVSNVGSTKPTKRDRTYYNAAMFKARTKIRAKHRDKRSANLTGD